LGIRPHLSLTFYHFLDEIKQNENAMRRQSGWPTFRTTTTDTKMRREDDIGIEFANEYSAAVTLPS
jgi:hypothetical protein